MHCSEAPTRRSGDLRMGPDPGIEGGPADKYPLRKVPARNKVPKDRGYDAPEKWAYRKGYEFTPLRQRSLDADLKNKGRWEIENKLDQLLLADTRRWRPRTPPIEGKGFIFLVAPSPKSAYQKDLPSVTTLEYWASLDWTQAIYPILIAGIPLAMIVAPFIVERIYPDYFNTAIREEY